MSAPIYSLKKVCKSYVGPADRVVVLDNVSLDIMPGQSVAVVGSSGSGKSTLLHILGTLDVPSVGDVMFRGSSLLSLKPAQKAAFRNKELGFVFQFHHLLPEFNTQENVAMQAIIGGMQRKEAMELAAATLELVGLEHRMDHAVTTLSGGERQRAAIARAILKRPGVILADEPTGNLDEKNGAQIAELMLRLNRDLGTTLIVVTHNAEIAGLMDRVLTLRGGVIVE